MDPMTWLMIGQTAAQLLGGANAEKQSKEMKAAELRAMPWTGRGPTTTVKMANPWSALAQGATAYMMNDANTAQRTADMEYRNKLLDRLAPAATSPAVAPAAPAASPAPAMDARRSAQALSNELGYDIKAPMSTMPEMQPWERTYSKPAQPSAPLVTPGADLRQSKAALMKQMGSDPFAPGMSTIPNVAPWDKSLIDEQMNPWIPKYQPTPWQGLYVPPTTG